MSPCHTRGFSANSGDRGRGGSGRFERRDVLPPLVNQRERVIGPKSTRLELLAGPGNREVALAPSGNVSWKAFAFRIERGFRREAAILGDVHVGHVDDWSALARKARAKDKSRELHRISRSQGRAPELQNPPRKR